MEVDRESRSRSRTPFIGEVAEMDNASVAETKIHKTRRTDKPKKPSNGLTNGARDKTELVTTVTTETVTVIETKAAKDSLNKSKTTAGSKKVREKEVINKHIVEKDSAKKVQQKEVKLSSGNSSDDDGMMRTINAYRAAGDWWETFPKTDFTYSPASRHRTATVAPGVKALPNMSRRSLHAAGDDAFRARTAETYGAAPTLPLCTPQPWRWAKTGASVDRLASRRFSDCESDGEEVTTRTTRTSSVTETTVTVWTRVTTTIVTVLSFLSPARWLGSFLDAMYLTVAYVRLLDVRVLAAIPRRSRRDMAALLALVLLLLFGAFLWQSYAPPMGTVLDPVHQSLASIGSFVAAPFPPLLHAVADSAHFLVEPISPAFSWVYSYLSVPFIWMYSSLYAGFIWLYTSLSFACAWLYLSLSTASIWLYSSTYAALAWLVACVVWFSEAAVSFAADVFDQSWASVCQLTSFLPSAVQRVPTTFIEFFSPMYNFLSPMLDLQLTLPNIY